MTKKLTIKYDFDEKYKRNHQMDNELEELLKKYGGNAMGLDLI